MSDDTEVEIMHIAPLDDDAIPNDNQAHHCHSCKEPFTGLYCAACGQKNDDYRRSIFTLIWETLGSITALEGRMWRTGGALLFKPGKVAREFADGARMKWSSPVRAYLAMSLLLFGYMSVFNVNIISLDMNLRPKPCVVGDIATLPADQIRLNITPRFFETAKTYEARLQGRNMAAIEKRLIENGLKFDLDMGDEVYNCADESASDTTTPTPQSSAALNISDIINETQDAINQGIVNDAMDEALTEAMNSEDVKTSLEATRDAMKQNRGSDNIPDEPQDNNRDAMIDENDDSIGMNDSKFSQETLSQFGLMFLRDPSRLNRSFASYIPRLMFFMMPLTMLIGAMFIRGRGNALLFDHLVHASYVHAITYFLLFVALVLSQIFPSVGFAGPLWLFLLIYLPISAKRMFARGWIKTIWTAYGVGFIYLVILFLGLIFLMSMQLQNTLTELDSLSRVNP